MFNHQKAYRELLLNGCLTKDRKSKNSKGKIRLTSSIDDQRCFNDALGDLLFV